MTHITVAPITPMNRGLKADSRGAGQRQSSVAPITPMNRGLKVFTARKKNASGAMLHRSPR